MKGGSYLLAELDDAVSKLRFTVFCIIPYHLRSEEHITVTSIMGMNKESLDCLAEEEGPESKDDEPEHVHDE
jgi:hypothetical protein